MVGEKPPIRVLVVDDHTMVAEAFHRVLTAEAGIDVVAVAGNASDAVKAVMAHHPDVVVLEQNLPDASGLDAAGEIRRRAPETRVVMVASRAGPATLRAALDAGCVGFLEKTESLDRLPEAVRAAAAGEIAVSLIAVRRLLGTEPPTAAAGPDLTARELQLLRFAAEGLGSQAIADRLHLSLNTVRTHLQRTITKLGAHSKLEAVARARARGLLEP